MHGSIVSWKAVFLFSLVMTLATLTGKAISLGTSVTVTANMAFLLSFAINVVFGGWYFAVRAFTRQGHPLGWAGAVQVSALAFVFLAITGILFGSIFHVLSS